MAINPKLTAIYDSRAPYKPCWVQMDIISARAGLQVLSSAHHRREMAYSWHFRIQHADSYDHADLKSAVFESFYNDDGN